MSLHLHTITTSFRATQTMSQPLPGSAPGTSVLKSHGLRLAPWLPTTSSGALNRPRHFSSLSVPLCKVDVSGNACLPSKKGVCIINSAKAAAWN